MRPGNWFTRPINFVRDAIALDRARRIRARLSRDFYANLPVVFGAHRTHAAFDRTKRYRELMAVSDLDSQMSTLLPALRRFRLLFLPGFLADVILATDKKSLQKELRQHTHLAQYFDEQISWLSSFNKPPAIERLQLASEAVPEINAEHIERALRSDGRPVILFAHSKGGIDAVESLLDRQRGRVRRDLLDRVRLLIAVQSPFFGSPAAGYLLANRLLRSVSRYTLESLGGSQAALQSLTRRARCEYYNQNRGALGRLTRALPVLCFLDRVVCASINDAFVFNDCVRNVIAHPPSDAAAGAGVDKSVLGPCVERVLAVNKFRMQNNVALLRRVCAQVR